MSDKFEDLFILVCGIACILSMGYFFIQGVIF
jgi:hypothetical protein